MLSLIVNPSAGGGRAGRALPDVAARCARHGLEFHVERTRSLEHARELALRGAAARRDGRGARRRRAGRVRSRRRSGTPPACSACCPAGAATTSRACSGSRWTRPRRARCSRTAASRRSISARSVGLGVGDVRIDRQLRLRLDANRIANETRLVRGNFVYTYAGLRALLSWQPGRLRADARRRAPDAAGDHRRGRQLGSTYGGGMRLAPDAPSRRRPVRRRADRARSPGCSSCASLPRVFRGTHVRAAPTSRSCARARSRCEPSRPFTMYADGDPIAELPVTLTLPARERST